MKNQINDLLQQMHLGNFVPQRGLTGAYAQTIAAYYWRDVALSHTGREHQVPLRDGEKLSLIEFSGENQISEAPLIVLVHGLGGSHESPYMTRLTEKFTTSGYRVLCLNLRGCGPGAALAAKPYHAGRSHDIHDTLTFVSRTFPHKKLILIGFSLGGNLILKMAGERGENQISNIVQIIAVSVPIELEASVKKITSLKNKVLDRHFVQLLRKNIQKLDRLHPNRPKVDLPAQLNLYQFDDLYTAPLGGFKSARDYYRKSSSFYLFDDIRIPTLLLVSSDDPLVSIHEYLSYPDHPYLTLAMTNKGGHQGFLASKTIVTDRRWMDQFLLSFVSQISKTLL